MFHLSSILLLTVVGLQLAAGVKYLGCYLDDASDRDLTVSYNLGTGITVQQCVNQCTSKAYKYAGLQGTMCYCGESYGKYSKVDDSKCNTRCQGETQQMCGAASKSSVYTTNYLGCWRDAPTRSLPAFYQMTDSQAKIETCVNYCSSNGYKYAGAQHYNQCFCGNSYGLYPELPKSSCQTTCKGNSGQKCGGSWANSVYVAKEECACQ